MPTKRNSFALSNLFGKKEPPPQLAREQFEKAGGIFHDGPWRVYDDAVKTCEEASTSCW